MVSVCNSCFTKQPLFITIIITSADLEGTGARSRLDAVLKGLVEKSENEKLVK